jgi:hypothetical protein
MRRRREGKTMKKVLATAVAVGLLASTMPARAFAGDREWATAGKILTGIVGLTILGNAIAHSAPAPVYGPPPRAYYPPERVWVPGHYAVRIERQWVPGHWVIERVPKHPNRGRYGDARHRHQERRVWVPGHYSNVEVRVWIPGHWEVRG